MKCPYCSAAQGRCSNSSSGRSITECTSCGRVVEERQTQIHHIFHLRAQDTPLFLSTSDLPTPPTPLPTASAVEDDEDPFEHTGFITTFSTWSLEHCPIYALSSFSFAGHLAELERALESSANSSNPGPGTTTSSGVVVDNLRAYLQIVDVASILRLEHDISDHAFQLFRDCSSATCLRNRSVEALATACLVQAIREAQEPRTLQEISIAANVPQKEIGKYIKILGEALQLSQPLNSNSISVHMPRFCNLLQLNKSAQELATHIGEVVLNKCFCTRRNPISISAAAIYLACQLEDRRKTQAEICKVTGLTEVTLRKVYKELLENWDDLLPSNYTPVVPPEKAFPTTTIATARSSAPRVDIPELASSDRDKQPEVKLSKTNQVSEMCPQGKGKEDTESKGHPAALGKTPSSWQSGLPFGTNVARTSGESPSVNQGISTRKSHPNSRESESKRDGDMKAAALSMRPNQFPSVQVPASSSAWPPFPSGSSSYVKTAPSGQSTLMSAGSLEFKVSGNQNGGRGSDLSGEKRSSP
ncbi:Plant-specific TFIIB- protein 1 [Ancistrocladus abbreviatus]